MITIVTIEGVLSRGDDLRNAQPTKIAKALYDGLKLTTNMIGPHQGQQRGSPLVAEARALQRLGLGVVIPR